MLGARIYLQWSVGGANKKARKLGIDYIYTEAGQHVAAAGASIKCGDLIEMCLFVERPHRTTRDYLCTRARGCGRIMRL